MIRSEGVLDPSNHFEEQKIAFCKGRRGGCPNVDGSRGHYCRFEAGMGYLDFRPIVRDRPQHQPFVSASHQ